MSIHVKKTEKKVMKYLTTEGIRLLLKQPDQKTWRGRRDLAMIALMYDIGARVQEIADITIGSIRSLEPYTIKITGKGNKTRIVPMMKEQMKFLIQYMQENQLLQNSFRPTPLFFNARNEKFTRAGISYILQNTSKWLVKKSVVGTRRNKLSLIKTLQSYAFATSRSSFDLYPRFTRA